MKKCVIYLKDEKQSNADLIDSLKKLELEEFFFNNKNELELWTREHEKNEVSLVIVDEDKLYLESVILNLFPCAYVIWIQSETHKNLREESRIKICADSQVASSFLNNSMNGFAPKEFKKRLLSKKHDSVQDKVEELPKEEHLERPSEEEVKSPEPISEKVPEKSKENITEQKNNHPPVEDNQDNHYYLRSRNLQKQLFTRYKREDHKMIGIWSPLHRTGVTTFTLNFALFLAQNRIFTAVLEGLTEQYTLKDRLMRYTSVPKGWVSYAKAIHNDGITSETDWTYKNVKFLPLDCDDMKHEWNELSVESFMTTTKVVDVTLVDFPTGELSAFSHHSIRFLDELWIIVTDDYQDNMTWKEYIHQIRREINVPIHLIFNQAFSFSQASRLAHDLSLSLLTTMPALHEEIAKNNYESKPIIDNPTVSDSLEPAFIQLAKHLFGQDFSILKEINDSTEKKWWTMLLKPLIRS